MRFAAASSVPDDRHESPLEKLANGPLFRFAEWPNQEVPNVAAGVYTVWDGDLLIYAGVAGRSLSEAEIQAKRHLQPAVRIGLASRLDQHASGRRSGNQFCVYVADRLVLGALDRAQVEAIASGELSLDSLVRDYVRGRLAFRFVETVDGNAAYVLEREVRRGALSCGKPVLNPL
jgi:hypothetical protein